MKKRNQFEQLLTSAPTSAPKRTPEEAAKLLTSNEISGYDRKLIANTVSEMFETAKMLQGLRTTPKITVFGSARTAPDHPDYILCKDFSHQAAQLGYMLITGAGPGIMAAVPDGAGPKNTIGVSIELPFEKGLAKGLEEAEHVITYKYFFNRKLSFVREADAIVLFPGGFGTMDEAFEVLTLLHTGRTMPVPLIFMEHEGGTYWKGVFEMFENTLLKQGMISPDDMFIYRYLTSTESALDYIHGFYRRYHSLRYIENQIVLRINTPLPERLREELCEKYADFLGDFGIHASGPLVVEEDEPELLHLPRLVIQPDTTKPVQLYCFIRDLNQTLATAVPSRHPTKIVERPSRVKTKLEEGE
jgi:hypothetical protein